ncbi:MAG TPA: alpha/beta hydrolase [Gemmataceae bacterium]|jgi:3-oxoadipate enol-lactonase|nr:alpha/beta hydrolase [Gemmataceae bacterium]
MPEVVVNGTRLHYQQHGAAGPDVVLLHAVTSNLAVWLFTGLVDALAADHRVTLFDFRGHGASERPPTGYTSADMADDFAGLHRELGLGPAYLVGHSFGGVVGLHAAVRHPDCVAGVILSDSFFPGLRDVEPNFGRANVWEDLRETYRKVGVDLGPTVDFTSLFRATAGLPADQLKALEDLVGPFGKGWLRQLPRLAETTCGEDVLAEAGLTAGRIAGVRRPVIALYDEFSPFHATSAWLAANVPGCVAEVIPAAKHLALVENPAGFTDAVRRHLNRLTGKAA